LANKQEAEREARTAPTDAAANVHREEAAAHERAAELHAKAAELQSQHLMEGEPADPVTG
jgi:hypothetical protein